MSDKIKVLISGDVEGQFNAFFNKVEATNKKAGPFNILLCVGNFFGVNNVEFQPYKNGIKKIPIPTYILGPNKEEHSMLYPSEEADLCENLYYLGKRGLYTVTGGLKIAYLSGLSTDGPTNEHNFSTEDAVALKDICLRNNTNFKGVDILLTSEWPENVFINTNSQNTPEISKTSHLVAWLSAHLKPRYHFCGLQGVYYERPPYRNNEFVTRFIGLARVANPKKLKWLYAANLMPLEKMKVSELVQKTTDETESPYDLETLDAKVFNRKRVATQKQQFFYDMSAENDGERQRKGKRQKVEFDQSKCWFCLASPSVEKHLVVTVGTYVYLAVAKGGLVDEHILISPIEHHQSAAGLDDDVLEEIKAYKEAIGKFYKMKLSNKVPVFYERNYKTSHMQIHAVPISEKAVETLKETFMDEADGNGFELKELDASNTLKQVVEAKVPYFVVELPTGEALYTKIKPSMGFPLEFARHVLASRHVLNMRDRVEWKQCALPEEEEIELVNKLRSDFEPFDIS